LKNIVIIGAGPAGLTAAYELLSKAKDEYSVTVLEGSSEIGGISRTVKYRGNRMDIGGHRFFSKDKEVTDWWENMMPTQGKPSFDDIKLGRVKKLKAGGPDPEETDRVMLVRNRVSRIYYKKKFFDYPISMKMQTIKNMGFASTVSAGCSYLGSCISKKPEDSLENFYINRFGKVLYSMFFEGYTEKLWGRHPRDISADWGAQRVKGLSIRAVLKDMFSKIGGGNKDRKVETSLIEEFIYPKYGPGQLWETVAEEVKKLGGEIRMNSEVVKINTADGKINSLELADGSAVEGDIFISSMPLKDLVGGMNDVPDDIAKIAAGLPYRDFVTVGLLVNKLNLKNETDIKTLGNIVPDCWIYVQDTGVKLGRIQIFNNWSPYMVEKPEDTVWIGLEYFCNENDDFWNLSDDECIRMASKELVSMGVINSTGDILDSHRERVKKAYPAYFDTYSEIDTLIKYLDSFDNLYCVGRNGQHRYNNMDHSMVTAFETAKNIISGKTSRDNIWNVNTEKEYHEEKND
jgi:protoporphyrinogen oxidase